MLSGIITHLKQPCKLWVTNIVKVGAYIIKLVLLLWKKKLKLISLFSWVGGWQIFSWYVFATYGWRYLGREKKATGICYFSFPNINTYILIFLLVNVTSWENLFVHTCTWMLKGLRMVVHASSVTILQVVELVCILLSLFLNVNSWKRWYSCSFETHFVFKRNKIIFLLYCPWKQNEQKIFILPPRKVFSSSPPSSLEIPV